MCNTDISTLNEIINEYKSIEKSIEMLENSISNLTNRKEDLLNRLLFLKKKEMEFLKEINTKYDKEEVTLNNLLKIYTENNVRNINRS